MCVNIVSWFINSRICNGKGEKKMSVTMYNCGFGDCFCIENEYVERPLYVDFGIHNKSLIGNKKKMYDFIANEMTNGNNGERRQCDFLLTHYHRDHYSGVCNKRRVLQFENVYIPDIWDENALLLIVLDIIFMRKKKRKGCSNILDVLVAVANTQGKLHLVSKGTKIGTGLLALWPEKNELDNEAKEIIDEFEINRIYETYWADLHRIVFSLRERIGALENQERMQIQTLTERREDTLSIKEIEDLIKQLETKISAPNSDYESQIKRFNNEISIVFQNEIEWCNDRIGYKKGCYDAIVDDCPCTKCIFRKEFRNLLFTGDASREVLEKIEKMDKKFALHEKYDLIKIPHHGTERYFFDFSSYISKGVTKCLISNELIGKGYEICSNYERTLNNAHIYCSKNACITKWRRPSALDRKIIDPSLKKETL